MFFPLIGILVWGDGFFGHNACFYCFIDEIFFYFQCSEVIVGCVFVFYSFKFLEELCGRGMLSPFVRAGVVIVEFFTRNPFINSLLLLYRYGRGLTLG